MRIKIENIPFIKYQWYFIVLSTLIIGFSIFSLLTKGLNYGTDFNGGAKLVYQLPKTSTEGELRTLLEPLGLSGISVVRYGNVEENRFSVRAALSEEMSATDIAGKVTAELQKHFDVKGLSLEQEETVGPKVGKELRQKGFLSVVAALFLILAYVGFRFDFQFAPGAVLALVHDVLIILGLFSFTQKEFDLTILAAVLTIVGFSLNDTIVIFDRIREHYRAITPQTIKEVVNRSLNETLSRTIITSLTVLFTVVILYFFGGGTMKDFGLAMLAGVVSGTYSTLFVATPAYIGMYKVWPKK